MRESMVLDEFSFASSSVPVHLLRGVIGLVLLVGAFALIPSVGPSALLAAPFGVVSLRGCPTCWAIGLAATISRGRLERSCDDSGCRIERAEDGTPAAGSAAG